MTLATHAVHLQFGRASYRVFIFLEHIPMAAKSYISQTKKNNMPT